MTPAQLLEFYGGRTKAAAAIGVTTETVRKWEDSGKIRIIIQHAIAHISKDRLKVDGVKK